MVTTLKQTKDLNSIGLEELVTSFRSHEIELKEDKPQKQGKYVALKSKLEKTKAYQVEEESEGYDEDSEDDDELSLISERVNRIRKHIHNGQGKELICFECKDPCHYKHVIFLS